MPRDSDNTEAELIGLLTKVLGDFFKEDRKAMAAVMARLTVLEQNQHTRHTQIMTALETLTESVNKNTIGQADLTRAVNAAVVELGADTPTDAQLLTLSAAIDANTTNAAALAVALDQAVTPPVVPTP